MFSRLQTAFAMANKYCLEKCIGRGNFGDVYKAACKRSGKVVAVKVVNLDESLEDMFFMVQEIQFLSLMRSPYIVQYLESFVENSNMWIIMEYCGGGSVADVLRYCKKFDENIAAYIIKYVLLGLSYLHKQKTVHRDVKLANVLVTTDGTIKLADFGVSGEMSFTTNKRSTFVGTPYWMAPEVIVHSKLGYNEKADIWSTGITTIELIKGDPPLADYDPMKILFKIPKQEPPLLTGDKYSDELKGFLEKCLVKNPRKRSSSTELLDHPFIGIAAEQQDFCKLLRRRRTSFLDKYRRRPRNPIKSDTGAGPLINWDFLSDGNHASALSDARLSPEGSGGLLSQNTPETAATTPASGRLVVLDNYGDLVRLCLERVKARASLITIGQSLDPLETLIKEIEDKHPGFCRAMVMEIVHVYSKVHHRKSE